MNFRWIFLLLIFFLPVTAKAHQVSMVQMEFISEPGEWQLLGEMDIAYMLPETRKIPGAPPLSRAEAMHYSPEEFARIRRETEYTLRKLLRITFSGQEVPWSITFPDFETQPFALPNDASNTALISTKISMKPVPGEGELQIHWAGEDVQKKMNDLNGGGGLPIHWAGEEEAQLVILKQNSGRVEASATLPGGSLVLLKQTASGASLPVKKTVLGGWLQMGYHHVLPEGRDHMLFILGLFLLAPRWKPLMWQSLLFTLAHSVTLGLSVFKILEIPSRPVEVLIAVSIAWIGIENLLTRRLGKKRFAIVFTFGLLHGLGFASSIGSKMEGIPRSQLAGPLLGFNVGVELAQLTILVVAFLVLLPLKKWSNQVQTAGSAFVAVAGMIWAVQRLFFPDSPIF